MLGDDSFARAVCTGDDEIEFAFIALEAREHNMAAVGRIADLGINIVDDTLPVASQHGYAKQSEDAILMLFDAEKINKIPVRRKFQVAVKFIRGRSDLRVAVRRNISEPKALLSAFALHMDNVIPVGRNRGGGGASGIRETRKREVFKRYWFLARDKITNSDGRRSDGR